MGCGTRDRRGYGTTHNRLRERYRQFIEVGAVVLCARCRRRILPGTPFDLDHTLDRSGYLGASHRRCNRIAGSEEGRCAHEPLPPQRRRPRSSLVAGVAGQPIGKAGYANAWHVHFMVNDGTTMDGVGDRDPKPFVDYARKYS